MKKILSVILVIAVVALGYMCYTSISTPVKFNSEQAKREALIQKQLKKIAELEDAFKNVNRRYATSDELKAFLQTGKVYYINAKGDYTDQMREDGLSEQAAAAKGLIQRDTVWVSAQDSLLGEYPSVDAVFSVAGFEEKSVDIQTATIEQIIGTDTIPVSVFQAAVPMEIYLHDLDAKILANKVAEAKARYNGKGYPGLAIGSLEEVKNTGNWE